MLKDLFLKKSNSKADTLADTLADGYVDIKAYRYNDKGEKTLVYHDTGDNTVTNWMRQVIVQLLAGVPMSSNGYGYNNTGAAIKNENSAQSNVNYTTYLKENHGDNTNLDGCLISNADYQYLHSPDAINTNNNVKIVISDEGKKKEATDLHLYPLFPTKVLLGTGKEYVSWEFLKQENEENNATWYTEMVENYGSGEGEEAASEQVNKLIEGEEICCNTYSATIGAQDVYSGSGSLVPTITVNDPDSTVLEEVPANLANRYGVVGAVKTIYLPNGDETDGGKLIEKLNDSQTYVNDVLNPTVSDSGKLIKTRYRGVGRPCFIYFNRTFEVSSSQKLDWSKQTSGVYVSKENKSSVPYLNRITFRVIMPAQKATGQAAAYYPYNGYTLKQVGLFNDALISSQEGVQSTLSAKMPCGTLLAIKNIASFTKTADEEVNFTWTLTI